MSQGGTQGAAKPLLPPASDQARKGAAQCFQRANEVAKGEDWDYAIKLMKQACHLVPDNLVYRQTLRGFAKRKFNNNKKGSMLAKVTTLKPKAALRSARAKLDFSAALAAGEDVLSENPWDVAGNIEMAGVFEACALIEHAVWCLIVARERDENDPQVNRALAHVLERRGDFTKASELWALVKKAAPRDEEADRKMKDLAASATIDRGGYDSGQSFTRALADPKRTAEVQDSARGGGADKNRSQAAILEGRIRNHPEEVSNYLQLATLHRRAAKYDDARIVLKAALDATGGAFEVQTAIADLEIERLRADHAVAERLARENPQDAAAVERFREVARTLNDFELREFQNRVERNPTDLGLKFELAQRLYKAGLHDQAIAEFQKVRHDGKHRVQAVTWLGRCFYQKKNVRLARRNFEEALALANQADHEVLKELHYMIGRLSEATGETQDAIEHYEEVANMDYAYRDASARLEALQGQGGEAPPLKDDPSSP